MDLYQDLPQFRVAGKRLVGRILFLFMMAIASVIGAVAGLLLVYSTDLPEVTELERYRPSAITVLYDDQDRVIGEFALQRRVLAGFNDFPKILYDAVVSIEDKDFEKHWGINLWRVAGALYHDIREGRRAQGASTLTMQLSRNLFLSPERSLSRKVQEILLSVQIERHFTKQQIFTLYGNQIFLGHGNYGFEAASQYYFSKPAQELTLEEAALLAGLPQGASRLSPINNPQRAKARRDLVINAMLEDGRITAEEATRAKRAPIRLNIAPAPNFVAPYFIEEVRRYLEKKYGTEQVHQGGLRVYTTLNLEMQRAANKGVLDGLAAYERRRGWQGGLRNVIAAGGEVSSYRHADWYQPLDVSGYVHALVTAVSPNLAVVKIGRYTAPVASADIAWTGRRSLNQVLRVGDIAYVRITALEGSRAKVALEQDSGAQVALMAMDNMSGDIKAMVGGRDFDESKFNRATQALRQVGSSFKPYVYTAAIDSGEFTPETVLVDAPTTFPGPSGPYTPGNYDGKYMGAIPLRTALAQSRNIPALKVANAVGIKKVIEYARRFGITSPIQPYLPVALGSAEVTLFEQTAAFAVFPNDGVRVEPRYIRKVVDYDGHVLEESYPDVQDVIAPKTARTMVQLMQGVVQSGTATAAKKLNHPLAGKTGTTNDFTDAWFVGYSPSLTCGVWVGFDEKKSLGKKETGGVAALPMWIEFMQVALKGRDKEQFLGGEAPDGPARNSIAESKPAPALTASTEKKQNGGAQ